MKSGVKFSVLCIIICFMFGSFLFSGSYALETKELEKIIPINFELLEETVQEGTYENFEYVDIELPSEGWRIRDVELNFTDINFGIEIASIEVNSSHNTYKRV